MINKLSIRMLIFNILLLFLPLGSMLYLDTYEEQLLEKQEESMIQQGRIFSAALTGENIRENGYLILEKLNRRVDSRIRILDTGGNLLADSAVINGEDHPEEASDIYSSRKSAVSSIKKTANQTLLYRITIIPLSQIKKLLFPPDTSYGTGEFYSGKTVLMGPEIQAAVRGRYGAITRISSGGQVSVNLYSAIPVWNGPGEESVIGVVLISRSTYKILLNLYELRLDIMKIFLMSLGAALIISLALSMTITRPLHKLKIQAGKILDKSGRFQSHFTGLKRKDEIGALSRTLCQLSENLEKRIAFIDQFTADMLHELKNPLAAIRGAAEMSALSPEKEEHLLNNILEEEKRMERLLERLREISRIDNQMDREPGEEVELNSLIPLILSRYPHKDFPDIPVAFTSKIEGKALITANPDRLVQMIANPVDNSVSLSEKGYCVEIELFRGEGTESSYILTIKDRGPGIPGASLPFLFNRFYSDRDDREKGKHSGLGLSIVKSIVEKYGGSCRLENRDGGGACFTLNLPAADK